MIEQFAVLALFLRARLDVRSTRGATAVEYAILISLNAAVIFVVVAQLGHDVEKTFQPVEQHLPDG